MEFKLPEKVTNVMKKFTDSGAEIFVVGGAVRDLLLDREVKDWDFTTNLTPEEMKKLFTIVKSLVQYNFCMLFNNL